MVHSLYILHIKTIHLSTLSTHSRKHQQHQENTMSTQDEDKKESISHGLSLENAEAIAEMNTRALQEILDRRYAESLAEAEKTSNVPPRPSIMHRVIKEETEEKPTSLNADPFHCLRDPPLPPLPRLKDKVIDPEVAKNASRFFDEDAPFANQIANFVTFTRNSAAEIYAKWKRESRDYWIRLAAYRASLPSTVTLRIRFIDICLHPDDDPILPDIVGDRMDCDTYAHLLANDGFTVVRIQNTNDCSLIILRTPGYKEVSVTKIKDHRNLVDKIDKKECEKLKKHFAWLDE